MQFRTPLGILAGFIFWWVLFYGSTAVFVLLWPALADAGRPVTESGDFSQLTTPMLVLFIAMYFWINPAAGWLTVKISKKRQHVWITMVPLLLFALFQHGYVLWDNLANWYNVAVPILIPPLMYVGARLAKIS